MNANQAFQRASTSPAGRCCRTAGIAALAAMLVASPPAHASSDECSAQALAGLYVFTATGSTIVSGVAQPKAIVEALRFNGDGTLLVVGATRSINGVVAQIPPGGTGTYTLGADCRGSLAFTGGPVFDIYASPRGSEFWMIQTNPDNVFQGNVKRVSR